MRPVVTDGRPQPATPADRERTIAEISAALDDGRIDLEDAGRRLSAVHRTRTASGLAALVADLAPESPPTPLARPDAAAPDGRRNLWAVAGFVVCAVLATVLLVLALRGLNPTMLR